ncbi:para-aminobenzoate synthetase/4-amino-4-deoxychorismate lyase [Chromohalobacter marismortui]|uniref:Para-aminobenzoate synthetase/4-amino-4-deoxychorismate lyase n=1 Tax=Chromohalobacter marismortui TaxID=42055 RepID=A0A4R7NLF0_9GAMM|nr:MULTISPECIES: aminodeoxychorismate synthase component I [Chromohalobacter]MCI0510177.1 aminodeoxychorismate synthase component I [Chromohalobacter sp.]MCI0594545.1 aminodeoxychorismate synthase component I [Chromohalobacter sp.]TDU21594.1 para-aminobenzoate synthetase/4-amino-4-deoxychorismate lyase [Chromohalobacter marismortui]
MQQLKEQQDDNVFILLENTRCSSGHRASLLFERPEYEVICYRNDALQGALRELDELRGQGYYVCGYLAYEAGYALADKPDFKFCKRAHSDTPLMHFYAFRDVRRLSQHQASRFLEAHTHDTTPAALRHLTLNARREEYLDNIDKIKSYIREGDTYQVNYTLKYRFEYQGAPIALYRKLRSRQKVEFGGLLNFPEYSVLSLSPELFLRKQGTALESKPMKGTFPRGASVEEDTDILDTMRHDMKTRSENVMIVDLLRNDVSRVASPGSVAVKNLFEIQTFETLHQMISTVTGRIAPDARIEHIFRELFPCGSITGAPKIRTMQIIEELEREPRGVYTGAIGYLTPNNDFCFNVPIRTCIAYANGHAEMGIGGGVLHESDPEAEYAECLLKARFLSGLNQDLQLFETMRYSNAEARIEHLENHLQRLTRSAHDLHFAFEGPRVRHALDEAIDGLGHDTRVRLSLAHDGQFDIVTTPLGPESEAPSAAQLGMSTHIIDQHAFLLHYKTSARDVYDSEYRRHQEQGDYDVAFLNREGRVTEASRHNLFIEKDGMLLTPPLDEGVLPGIARETLIAASCERCCERPITPRDLLDADAIWLTNAVRGVVPVMLSEQAIHTLTAWVGQEATYAVSH